MEYIITLVETARHVVMVEADSAHLAEARAKFEWLDGELLDDRPKLLSLECVQVDEVPTDDVA